MGRLNPESKRGRVRLRFHADGQEAADALAVELGVEHSKRKRWFKMWSEEAPASVKVVGAQAVPVDTARVSANVRALRSDPANRVRWLGGQAAGALGTIVQRGPEQSVVRWDNGNEVCVANEWVIQADLPDPPPPPRKRLKVKA